MRRLLLFLSLHLLSSVVEVYSQQTYPYVSFMSQTLANHSYVDITTVGDGSSDSVQCITDLTSCCSGGQGPHRGDWYFPNGDRLQFARDSGDIFEQREAQRVNLRRRDNANSPTGIYRCEIPTNDDNIDVRETVYIGLYTSSGGDVAISGDMVYDSDQMTLTCISTGGPATTVTWTRDSTILTEGTKTVFNDPVTAQYTHTLMVDGGQEGLYRCNVSNNKPSSAIAELNFTTPPPPSDVGLQQRGEGRLEVTWTPSGGSTVNGYIIYYQLTGGEEMSVIVNGRTTVSTNITGLSAGTYSVNMTATSTSLLSSRTSAQTVVIVPPPTTPVVTIMSVTATSISLSWTSGGTGVTYEVEWQRDTTGECSDIDRGSETITDGSTSYVIMSVEEDSMYTVTVTATNIAGSVSDSEMATTSEAAPSSPPSSVTTSSDNSTSITVSWGPVEPCIHQNGDITGYSVRYGVKGNETMYTISVSGGNVYSTTINDLLPSLTYTIQVAAFTNSTVIVSNYTSPIDAMTRVGLTLNSNSINSTSISLSWYLDEDGLSATTNYTINYTTANTSCFTQSYSDITGISGTSHTLTGLEEYTEYTITVSGTVTGDRFVQSTVTNTTSSATPSAAPSGITLRVQSSTSITVEWGPVEPCRDRNGLITGYSVRYNETGIKSITGDMRMATITELRKETEYRVEVAGVTIAGTGVYSNPISITTPDNVFLSLNGRVIPNYGYVNITDIGVNDTTALICQSSYDQDDGEWFGPNGDGIHYVSGFTSSGGNLTRSSGTPPHGLYKCSIMGAYGFRSLYVGLYNDGEGVVNLTGGITFDTLSTSTGFTLTCNSTGGPPTTVTWTRDSTNLTEGSEYAIDYEFVNGVTGNVGNILTVKQRHEGVYKCSVTNVVSIVSSAELNVTVPSPPTELSVVQNGLNSVLVAWTLSTSPSVTGYELQYLPQGERIVTNSTTYFTEISGLNIGVRYNISISALSNTLPSNKTFYNVSLNTTTITITPSPSVIRIGVPVTLTCSISLPSGVTGTPSFQWAGPNETPPTNSISNGGLTSNLTITKIAISDAGTYQCTAILKGNVTAFTNLTIQVMNPTPLITQSSSLIAGDNGSLMCNYTLDMSLLHNVSSVIWSKDGSQLNISSDNELFINFTPATTADSGNYSCSLNLTSQLPHIIIVGGRTTSPDKTITVQIPRPNITVYLSRPPPLYIGTEVTVSCDVCLNENVNNSETVSIEWIGRHEDGPPQISHDSHMYSRNLTISPLANDDNGTNISCQVTVSGGPAKTVTSYYNITIFTADLPSPNVSVSSVTTQMVGDRLQLDCTVTTVNYLTSSAELPIWWTSGDITDIDGATESSVTISGTTRSRSLTFPSLNTSHGAVYTCHANLTIPSIPSRYSSDDVEVRVQIPRPEVMISVNDVEIVSGSPLSLTCSIIPPSVDTSITILSNWSTPSNTRRNEENETYPTFNISNTVTANSGDYVCSVVIMDTTGSPYVLASPITPNTTMVNITLRVTVTADYHPAPEETRSVNEFIAGSNLSLICSVVGNSNELSYIWSVMPDTVDCDGCTINTTSSFSSSSSPTDNSSRLTLGGPPLYSYYAGNYTCSVSEVGRPFSNNSDQFSVYIIGAGLNAITSNSSISSGPIDNNGLVVSDSSEMVTVDCVSNSSRSGRGTITTPNGTTIQPNATSEIYSPYDIPGLIRIEYSSGFEEGIYTCIIPDNNEVNISLNVGLYPRGFNDRPSIKYLTYEEENRTLTCVSNGSLPTRVMWRKDGNNLDGIGYSLSQTIIDRQSSVYSNVLTVNEGFTATGNYTCTISNDLGEVNKSILAVGVNISGLDQSLVVGESVNISCNTNTAVSSIALIIGGDVMDVVNSTDGVNLTMLTYTIELVTDDMEGQRVMCQAEAGTTIYTETTTISVTVPDGALSVMTTNSGSIPILSGGGGYTINCTVNETILGLTDTPTAQWTTNSRPVESINGVNVTTPAPDKINTTNISTLSFLSPSTSTAGVYNCTGTLESPAAPGGNITSTTGPVQIEIKLPPPNVTLDTTSSPRGPYYEGTVHTIVCTATLPSSVNTNVMVTVLWKLNQTLLPLTNDQTRYNIIYPSNTTTSSPFISTLTISPLTMNDTGTYSCEVTADSSNVFIIESEPTTDTYDLSVSSLPAPNVSISLSENTTVGQDTTTITCSSDVVDGLVDVPNVILQFPNSSSNITMEKEVVYTFSPLMSSDGGQYTCYASISIPLADINNLTSDTAMMDIVVNIPQPTVQITGQLVSLVNDLSNTTLYSGTVLTMMCEIELVKDVDTNVTVTTQWRFGDIEISDNSRVQEMTTADRINYTTFRSSLIFNPLNTPDSGMYSCSATIQSMRFINGSTGVMSQNITVRDLQSPNVSIGTEGEPTAGENYTLVCTMVTVEGVRPENISILWSTPHNTLTVAENINTIGTMTTGYLPLSPLTTTDSGVYYCIGRIALESIAVNVSNSTSVIVNVTIPPPDVQLTTSTNSTVAVRGTKLVLTCSVSVSDHVDTDIDADITWTTDSQSVLDDPNLTISNTTRSGNQFYRSITLLPVTSAHSAFYTCSAVVFSTDTTTDDILSSNMSSDGLNITVEEPTDPVVVGSTVTQTAGLPFTINCNYTSQQFVNSPSIQWLDVNGTVVSYNETLHFSPLNTSHGGVYTCQVNISINGNDLLTGSNTTTIIVQMPAPTLNISESGTPYNGTVFNLTCHVILNESVDVKHDINYSWNFSDPNTDTLTGQTMEHLNFNPLSSQDSRYYTCSVNIEPSHNKQFVKGSSSSVSTTVTVQALPDLDVELKIFSRNGSGEEDCLGVDFSTLTDSINCTAKVVDNLYTPPNITLLLPDGTIHNNLVYTPDGALPSGGVTCSVCIDVSNTSGGHCDSDSIDISNEEPVKVRARDVEVVNDTAITISWTSSPTVLRYLLELREYVSNGIGTEKTEVVDGPHELATTTASYPVSSLRPEVPYDYRLVAGNSHGCGDIFISKTFFTKEGVPDIPPHNVVVTRINGTAMNVSFTRLSLVEAKRNDLYYFISYQLSPETGRRRRRRRQGGERVVPAGRDSNRVITLDDHRADYVVSVFTATNDDRTGGVGPRSEPVSATAPTESPPAPSPVGIVIGVIVAILVFAILVLVIIIVIFWIKRSRDRENFQLFSKRKNLYAPSSPNEMVTLRSTSPNETEEARKKELEASNEMETFDPIPLPQNIVEERMKPISVDSFRDHVNSMHEERDRGFEAEYQSLGNEPKATHEIAKKQFNRSKNRFANIFPYDESRVKLKEISEEDGSDYINACWMNGYNREKVYIAAQGPMPNTIADFWRMVWEYKIQHIVMLTKCLEAGRRKCEQYWADNIGDVFETQDKKMEITTTSSMPFADFEIRTFNAKNTTLTDEKPLSVTQYHFTSWPDHGVPKFATSLISFIRRVQKAHNKEEGVPLLVHCSAGVGRTGTFILLDSMLERIKSDKTVNVYEFLTGLRKNRVLMVQTLPQYVFIHDALCELITCGETDIAAPGLKVKIQRLSKVIAGKAITGFEEQFQLLDQVSREPEEEDCSDAREHFNRSKNRYADRPPYNMSRARLRPTGEDGSEYINASFLDGYKRRNAYIATQGPLANTVGDFWRMMWEFKSKVMVMLCSLTEDGHEACHSFWPYDENDTQKYGKITVTLQSETPYDNFIQRKMLLQDDKAVQAGQGEGVVVTQFQLTEWPEHGRPVSTGAVVEMLEMITKAQMNTGNRSITVLCNDGVGRTGTFICLHSQLERLKTEGIVDIFQAVKSARIQRAGLVPDADQYAYIHEVLADFVNSYDNYANFKDVV